MENHMAGNFAASIALFWGRLRRHQRRLLGFTGNLFPAGHHEECHTLRDEFRMRPANDLSDSRFLKLMEPIYAISIRAH